MEEKRIEVQDTIETWYASDIEGKIDDVIE